MLTEVLAAFAGVPAGWLVDMTLGGAGHAAALLAGHRGEQLRRHQTQPARRASKPEPLFFERVACAAPCAAQEILYVGDHLYADVHVSKNVLRWRTALGLVAAIPAVVAFNRFSDQVSRLELRFGDAGPAVSPLDVLHGLDPAVGRRP